MILLCCYLEPCLRTISTILPYTTLFRSDAWIEIPMGCRRLILKYSRIPLRGVTFKVKKYLTKKPHSNRACGFLFYNFKWVSKVDSIYINLAYNILIK